MSFIKICHLTSVHSPMDTRIFIKECKSLASYGFEVHYIVPTSTDSVIENIHIHGVEKSNSSSNRIERMTKVVKSVYDKALLIDADVYHFHDPELIRVGLKLKKKGKKVIYDIHEDLPRAILSKKWINPMLRKPMAHFFEWYENKASKKFDILFTATPFITERFIKKNINTINLNNYPLLEELKNEESSDTRVKKNQLCYIGGLGPIRGSKQILEAANKIEGTLHIAGPITPENTKTKILSHPNIKYHGILDRLKVKDLLSNSIGGIVTFLPEPNHINSQPNKMFEYMSASIPVICSDFPLWRSIIEKHNCGICVDPENPQAIADTINYLIKNPDIVEKMGQNARKAVESVYNWEQESIKLINVYKNLVN